MRGDPPLADGAFFAVEDGDGVVSAVAVAVSVAVAAEANARSGSV